MAIESSAEETSTGRTNLDDGQGGQAEVAAHVLDERLHAPPVRLRVVLRRRVALALVPQQRLDLAAAAVLDALPRPPHHALVQVLPARPLPDRRAPHRARHQAHRNAGRGADAARAAPAALPQRVREGHPRAHAAGLPGVDVAVEGLPGLLPAEGGGEAEDGGVGAALRGDDPVPAVVARDAAAAGHVALAGEDEDVLGGRRRRRRRRRVLRRSGGGGVHGARVFFGGDSEDLGRQMANKNGRRRRRRRRKLFIFTFNF